MLKLVSEKTQASRAKKDLCPVYGCRNKRGTKKAYCHKHHARQCIEKNPLSYKYDKLKESARRRNKPFTITRENFIDWATFHGFSAPAKLTGKTLSVDCKNPAAGYQIFNIRPLTVAENAAKGKKSYVQYYKDNPHLLTEGQTAEDFEFLDWQPENVEVPF